MAKEKSSDPDHRRSSKARVLFVCVGNACRSPMAEAIARYDAADVIEPSSAGLAPLGQLADLTKDTLLKNGYSFSELSSAPLTPEAMQRADIIINMTGKPHEEIFGEFHKVEDWIVEDPFGSDANTYQHVFEGIQRRVHLLADSLREARQTKKAER